MGLACILVVTMSRTIETLDNIYAHSEVNISYAISGVQLKKCYKSRFLIKFLFLKVSMELIIAMLFIEKYIKIIDLKG